MAIIPSDRTVIAQQNFQTFPIVHSLNSDKRVDSREDLGDCGLDMEIDIDGPLTVSATSQGCRDWSRASRQRSARPLRQASAINERSSLISKQ